MWQTYAVLVHPRKQSSWWAAEAGVWVAQPGPPSQGWFGCVSPLKRPWQGMHVGFCMENLTCKVFSLLFRLPLRTGDSVQCEQSGHFNPPGSFSLAMVAVFSLSWQELVKVTVTSSREWGFRVCCVSASPRDLAARTLVPQDIDNVTYSADGKAVPSSMPTVSTEC